MSITVHSIVRNEDQFIWYALMSVLPYVSKVLIYDTGSSDQTSKIVKSINSPKIVYEEKGVQTPEGLVALRQEQIDQTDSDFFMILDGDEIWPSQSIKKLIKSLTDIPKEKIAIYCRTRNAVGDIYHYLPEDAGAYHFQGKTGNFAMRAFRNVPKLSVGGVYPLETYMYDGKSLNNWDDKLQFIDAWYLHATHLKRSSSSNKILGFRSQKVEMGIKFKPEEIPEVLVLNSQPRRSIIFESMAAVVTPLKILKRINEKV